MQAPATIQSSKWKTFFKKKNTPPIIQPQIPITQNSNKSIQKSKTQQHLLKTSQSNQVQGQPSCLKQNDTNHQVEIQDSIKQAHSQTTNDSQPQQTKNNQQKVEKQVLSGQAKKLLSILQFKSTNKSTFKKPRQIQKKEPEKQQVKTQIQKSQQPKQQKIKNKLKTGHYKIFNPDHFEVKNQQIKTSIHRWKYGSGQTPKKLLIHSWNVNGIRARMTNNDILPYLESNKPDIFCINETKLDEKSFNQNKFQFYGYNSYWNFPKYSLGYSGVAVFSKYPAIQMFEDIHIPQHSKQGRVITLQFDKFVLINIYVPTTGRELQRLDYRVKQYDPAFRQYVINTKQKFPLKTIIICGDLNVAHGILDCHTGKRMKQGKQPAFTVKQRTSFSTLLKTANLVDTFRHFHPNLRQYTWWNMRRGGRKRNGDTGIGKRLDYFLVDEPSMKYVKASQIRKEVEGCDHCPVELRLEFQ